MHLRVWASDSPAKEEVVYRRCTRGRQRAMLLEPTQLFGFGDQKLKFFQGPGPVLAQQTGKCSVCEQLAACLACGAIVRFIGGITDALDFSSATRTGKFVAAVNGHAFAKRGDF